MNVKQEFIKSILNVLRLDNNIFITGAIEKILEDVEQQDYVMLLAFLGDRKSDYEKPIQSITNAVKEFYDKKYGARLLFAKNKARGLCIIIKWLIQDKKEIKQGYEVQIQAGEYQYEKIRLFQNDIEIINSLGGFEKLSQLEDDILQNMLFEKYFGRKEKKTISQKIEESDQTYLQFKPKGF